MHAEVCISGLGSSTIDSLQQQHDQQQDQQQLQGGWQQPAEPRWSPGPVSGESSPGCRLVFDIDSHPRDLPELAPLTQQRWESSEHNGSQQQVLEQQMNTSQTSEPVIGNGFMNTRTFDGCRLEFDIDSCPEEVVEQAQQQQQQQPISNQQASRSVEGQAATDESEGCRLVYLDIDSDPQDSPEQPLRRATWQPTVESHVRSGDSPPSGHCRVSMIDESQLTDWQVLQAPDNRDAMDACFVHYPQTSSSVRHSARCITAGLYQRSLYAQTPTTPLASMQSP